MKLKFIYFTIFLFIISVFDNYDLVLNTSIEAVNIWLTKVFPFLFIMFIITDTLINLNFSTIFKTSSPFILFSSLISGAPSSAFIISNLYQKQMIDQKTANLSLLFSYFANPLFLIAMLSSLFNSSIAIKLILIHYSSNFIIYFFTKKHLNNQTISNNNPPSFNISHSIQKSINTLIMILGTITFYMVLSNIIIHYFNFNPLITSTFKGILEVTQGLNSLFILDISEKIKEIIAISFISFGGLSIHTQIQCLLKEQNLSYKYFLKGRIIQVCISILLTLIF